MRRTLPSIFADSGAGMGCVSLPFGPSARTVPSVTSTFTPCGMGTGFLPMRDISDPLPHVGENFAADVLDEPLLLEQLGDADLQPAGGDVALLMLGPAGVTNASEEVGDGIAAHATSSPSRRPEPRP